MDQRRTRTRGRSRQVSNIALARKASEERHAHHKPRHTPATSTADQPRSTGNAATEIAPSPRQLGLSNSSSSATSARQSRSPSPQLTSASASPANTASPASPLDTDESLEDQLHMAYALDNMDLCKVIYLKLKGITITGSDDPRLAAVQPEDFDECFLPNGSLMESEEDWAPVQAKREEERQRLEALQRAEEEETKLSKQAEWETTAGNRWHMGQKKYTVVKIQSQKLREDEEKRLKEQQELRSRESSERSRRRTKAAHAPLSQVPPRLSYDSLSTHRSTRPSETPLAYPAVFSSTMQIPKKRVKSRQSKSTAHAETSRTPTSSALASSLHTTSNSSPSSSSRCTSTASSPSDSIPFKVVVASMRGQIFPPDPSERKVTRSHSGSIPSAARSEKKSVELLDTLLQPVEWQEGEHILRQSRKGKEREVPRAFPSSRSSSNPNKCAACLASSSSSMSPGPSRSNTSSTLSSIASSTSPSSSRASSFFSRHGSWLSFGTSSSVASTVLTTPSSSPSVGSWFKPSGVAPAILSPVTESRTNVSYQCTCSRPFTRLTPIPATEGPLPLDPMTQAISSTDAHASATAAADLVKPTLSRSDSWSVHMSRLVALAKGFQAAYVGAVVFAAVPSLSADWEDNSSSRERSGSRRGGQEPVEKRRLYPPGYRARSLDVAVFLYQDEVEEQSQGPTKSIPLLSPFPPVPPQSTLLPSALPYELRFRKSIPPTPSPMKRFAQMAIAAQGGSSSSSRSASPARSLRRRSSSLSSKESTRTGPVPRARFVPNPVYLRLRAIQNIVGSQSMGYGPDGTYSCGRERLVGVAFEEIGRSGLCVEEHAYQERQKVTYGRDLGVFSVRR